jgi:ATP-dependent DNA helicase PIF1
MSSQPAENDDFPGSPAPKREPMDSLFPTPSSAASKRSRDRAEGSEVQDLFISLERPASTVSLGDSILSSRTPKRARIQHEHTLPQSPAQGASQFDRSQAPRAEEHEVQAILRTENETGGSYDPFAVPAYGKGPKLRYDELDEDQKRVVNLATRKRTNICCVGGAGTGKSETCEIIVDEFTKTRIRVAIVAPSGTAAVNVRAQTLHSFFGLGASTTRGIDQLVKDMRPTTKERIDRTDVLIIDEISMVSYETFDRIDRLARAARDEPKKPFGGMQLIVFGDFCQLPPVKPYENCFQCGKERKLVTSGRRKRDGASPKVWRCPENAAHGDIPQGDKMWSFKSLAWRSMQFVDVPLTHIHRQHDPDFLAILANVRYGKPFTPAEVDLLMSHECDVTNAVELASARDRVKSTNNERFKKLPGTAHRYQCQDDFIWQRDLHPELDHIRHINIQTTDDTIRVSSGLRDHQYEETVQLKPGQPVILQKNIDVHFQANFD